jgi:hypothetical protein
MTPIYRVQLALLWLLMLACFIGGIVIGLIARVR